HLMAAGALELDLERARPGAALVAELARIDLRLDVHSGRDPGADRASDRAPGRRASSAPAVLVAAGARSAASASAIVAASALACRPCMDWSERRPHLAGPLATRICRHLLDRGWLRR